MKNAFSAIRLCCQMDFCHRHQWRRDLKNCEFGYISLALLWSCGNLSLHVYLKHYAVSFQKLWICLRHMLRFKEVEKKWAILLENRKQERTDFPTSSFSHNAVQVIIQFFFCCIRAYIQGQSHLSNIGYNFSVTFAFTLNRGVHSAYMSQNYHHCRCRRHHHHF